MKAQTAWARSIDWTQYKPYQPIRGLKPIGVGPLERALQVVRHLKIGECVLVEKSTGMVDRLREKTGFVLLSARIPSDKTLMVIWRDS